MQSDKLLEASEALVKEIERSTKVHSANIVNVSGRQRMLSQRVAKLYLAEAWRIDNVHLKKEMNKAIEEFDDAFMLLNSSSLNTPSITSQLKKVQNQ